MSAAQATRARLRGAFVVIRSIATWDVYRDWNLVTQIARQVPRKEFSREILSASLESVLVQFLSFQLLTRLRNTVQGGKEGL